VAEEPSAIAGKSDMRPLGFIFLSQFDNKLKDAKQLV
jgi:hypothetical protein